MLISTAGAIGPSSPLLQLHPRVTKGEFNQGAGPWDAASASETQFPAANSPPLTYNDQLMGFHYFPGCAEGVWGTDAQV